MGAEIRVTKWGGKRVPTDEWWIASWNDPDATDVSVYVDVTTKPVRHADTVHAVDLDLDVVRLRDGRVQVVRQVPARVTVPTPAPGLSDGRQLTNGSRSNP